MPIPATAHGCAPAPSRHRTAPARRWPTRRRAVRARSGCAAGLGDEPVDDGRYLNFAATVWNAGDSPLVVDGFREKGKPVMDAYQYFYDAARQPGRLRPGRAHGVGPAPTHHHWHFEDFARYQLLGRRRSTNVQRSPQGGFCLADTDAIDFTVPGALWHPYNTDLATACGDFSALAVSE